MRKSLMAGAVALLVAGLIGSAQAQEPPDILHAGGGQITWTNVNPDLYYTVQWRSSLTGGEWRSVYKDFRDLQSDEGTLTQSIPVFFRIVAHEAPEYLRYMSPTSHWMEAGYYPATNLALVDPNLKAENIRGGTTVFGISGTVLPAMGDATPEDVLAGKIFSNSEASGAEGTMPNQADQGFMPGAADVPIPAGYYNGSGVVAGDAALAAGNIRAGTTIFGVAGDPNVVDTSVGDALAADLLAYKVAYVGGTAVTGTIATLTLSPDSAEVAEGFYAATNLTLVATNLVAANIRYGISIFGVAGTHEGAGSLSGMSLIPAGDFVKTDYPDNDYGGHWVTNYISAFYMDRTHVTKALWDEVREWGSTNGYTDLPDGGGKGADHPVQTVNWYAVVKWCNARSEMEGRPPVYFTNGDQTTVYRTGNLNLTNACVAWSSPGYRLPTESEWEKAARGGLHAHRFPWGHTTNRISHAQANFRNTSGEAYQYGTTGYHPSYTNAPMPYTSPVGSFAPNGYGLYDMSGNVWGWCWDRYGVAASYYVAGSDPKGPDSGPSRVYRGGCWRDRALICRVTLRNAISPSYADNDYGIRVVLPSAVAP